MSELKPTNLIKGTTMRGNPEEELVFLRRRVAELEAQSQQLYQQTFLLQQRLSASNLNEKERAEFISHVAHELRTPLTSIKGYVDLVLEGETGAINDLQREFLSVVGLNAEKLSRIIGDLLDVSRLEAGQLGFKPILIDLRELVGQTCIEVRPQLTAKGVELEISSQGTIRLPASIDPERFGQALRAIIAHAGQITPEGKMVRVTISSEASGAYAIIKVEDEGPGIAPNDMDRVFTKFWRPDNQAWREGGGPGLGLAIAKTIIDIHEGKVRADNRSAEQGGSVITITIPLLNVSVDDLQSYIQEEDERAEPPHYAALVISQNPDFGKVVQQTLGKGGFQVIVTSDRSELVSETPSWQPDLIINNGAEPELLSEDDNKTLGPALRGAAILTLNLSLAEQRVIAAGAQAVLPWPTGDSFLLENLEQAMLPEKADDKLAEYKQLQTILLVSPSSEALRSLDKLTHEAGYTKIYRAMSEAEALTLARRYRPNWLLLDLPGGVDDERTGPALFELLREDQLLSKTPTIIFLRPEQIAADPSPDYRPSFVGKGAAAMQRRLGTGELRRGGTTELGQRARRGSTGELRRGGTGELRRGGTGELGQRTNGTDELKGLYYNVVPKPFMQRRLINVARRLATQR